MRRNVRTVLQATVILLALGITVNAQPIQVTEIPTASTGLVKAGDFVYFTSSDSLLRTDGTESGTTFLRSGFDINPGPGDGFLGNSALVGNDLYFRGNNGVNGDEPWKSNGTAAGTMMIEDINPGAGNGFVSGNFDDEG